MSEENRAEQKLEGTQVEPMPSSEQTKSVEVASEEVVAEKPVAEPSKATDNFELPEEVSRRTREQFNKLKEQLDFYKYQNSRSQEPTSLYDDETGLINRQGLDKLNQTASLAEQRARAAEEKLNRYLDSLQEKEAYAEFPELNPSNTTFDRELHKLVRSSVTDSMVNPVDYGGKELTMVEAARLITSIANKKVKKVEKEVAKQVVNQLTPKEEASLEAKGRSDRAPVDVEDIRERSRKGDRLAVIERLKRLSGV